MKLIGFLLISMLATLLSTHLFASQPAKTAHQVVDIQNRPAFEDAEFSLKINDIVMPYSLFSVFVMPNEQVEFEVLYAQSPDAYTLISDEKFMLTDTNRWQWQAPDTPGLTSVIIESPNKKQRMKINVFVKVPADKVEGGKLKYYQIGHYPKPSQIKDSKHYIVPDGFVEVTPENEGSKLSPHFSLKEFVSKQKSNHPKYLFLQNKLLLKLEMIRKELILEGIPVSNMVVMSGYRTPYYNKAIGNVKLSRHVFGDAADIFIDNDGNYRMDDINKDAKYTIEDAKVMASIVESLAKRESFKGLLGGLGVYGPKPHRGAFIHVDTRGFKARWVSK